ncbi:hypothetical protein MYX04_10700 [Nitrospiraceae bacterium AH_259_D15_M11_P09]|nr:hypothetical protein [Nitrospiraceae bacterium AH_259_D15_M11_P09]
MHDIAKQLGDEFPAIRALYLFGSRRFRSGSSRSDVDVLVVTDSHVKPADLRAFTNLNCPPLDLFLVTGAKAVSCANESHVEASSFDELVDHLSALLFWTRDGGSEAVDIEWIFSVPVGIDFPPTAMILPEVVPPIWAAPVQAYFKHVADNGLPTRPFIAGDARRISDFLAEVIRALVTASMKLNPKGKGWKVQYLTEYDFQNIFYLCVKPWLAGLAREEITIRYDGQNKLADFNLFGNQIILEMKHVRDNNTKAAVAKTLAGLTQFYKDHPNVAVLLFAVLVDASVDLDEAKWQNDFTYDTRGTDVRTVVIRVPA